jgi:hypothetical protein
MPERDRRCCPGDWAVPFWICGKPLKIGLNEA